MIKTLTDLQAQQPSVWVWSSIVVILSLLVAIWTLCQKTKHSSRCALKGHVTDVFVYPVKSCKGTRVKAAIVERRGLLMDRLWMVIGSDGRFRTQRQIPRMSQIAPDLPPTLNDPLTLSAPDMEPITVPPVKTGGKVEVIVWNDKVTAFDQGPEVAAWLGKFLHEEGLRLVRFDDSHRRQVDLRYARPGQLASFQDGFPFLLTSQKSLDDVNSRMHGHMLLPMDRFRPNIVINGENLQPWEEDNWYRVRIGEMQLRLTKPCSRCKIPNTNQETSEVGDQPGLFLREFRNGLRLGIDNSKTNVYFGQNAVNDSRAALIMVGDTVEVYDLKKQAMASPRGGSGSK